MALTSTINRWVVGSLYSAWRAVSQYLSLHDEEKQGAFFRSWGKNEYWVEGAAVPDPSKGSRAARRDADDPFTDAYRQLMNRNIDIALQADGLMF